MKVRSISFITAIVLFSCNVISGQEKVTIYNPDLDGMKQIKEAVGEASESGRHVFIQVGGNWCPWCVLFHKFCDEQQEVKDFIEENFVVVKLNWSPENKNEEAMTFLEKPGRFGFPVFVILDGTGKRLHTQDSGLLEEGRGYDLKKVTGFLKGWSPGAF